MLRGGVVNASEGTIKIRCKANKGERCRCEGSRGCWFGFKVDNGGLVLGFVTFEKSLASFVEECGVMCAVSITSDGD